MMAALVSAAFLANTSATCPASPASNPKARRVEEAMSALLAKSSPEEAAKSSIPGIAAVISDTENPADARFSIASALSVAEKEVAFPNSIACCSRSSNSDAVAPEIALTRLICASKSLPAMIAAVPTPIKGVVTPIVSILPMESSFPPAFLRSWEDISKEIPMLASLLSARVNFSVIWEIAVLVRLISV